MIGHNGDGYLQKMVDQHLENLKTFQQDAKELKQIFTDGTQDITNFIEYLQDAKAELKKIRSLYPDADEQLKDALFFVKQQTYLFDIMKQNIVFAIEKWRNQFDENKKKQYNLRDQRWLQEIGEIEKRVSHSRECDQERKQIEILQKRPLNGIDHDYPGQESEFRNQIKKQKKIEEDGNQWILQYQRRLQQEPKVSRDQKPQEKKAPSNQKGQKAQKPLVRIINFGKLKNFEFQIPLNDKSENQDDQCFYCKKPQHEIFGQIYRVSLGQQTYSFHDCCSVWTNELYFKGSQNKFCFTQIKESFENSSLNKCQICQLYSASLRCEVADCKNYYHFPCFMSSSDGVITDFQRFQFKCADCSVRRISSTAERGKGLLNDMIQTYGQLVKIEG